MDLSTKPLKLRQSGKFICYGENLYKCVFRTNDLFYIILMIGLLQLCGLGNLNKIYPVKCIISIALSFQGLRTGCLKI